MTTDTSPERTRQPREDVALRQPVGDDRTICESIFTTVATAEDRPVTELDPLGETVDSDALNALFPSGLRDSSRELAFHYAGYTVVVTDEAVTLLSPT
ncbi:HalOD1 output domain-containing protein [Halalkalicoccus tibetensis]|uniref:HalOD1 output domain-containing protein n=1 Tax=Halalkalicoccus tibetensis TaxID=175632 RepID=A0ABD5V2W8_9EURY